jgi:phosphatidylinositol phospholipase C delta
MSLRSRIYPKGNRIDSSNLDVIPAWSAGNQLVALNYQTPGIPMHLNHGKFMENGEAGYVLKPPYMLSATAHKKTEIQVHVHVISGCQLPKPGGNMGGEVIDPYVEVSCHGPEKKVQSFRTATVDNNGFNPVFDEVCRYIYIYIYINHHLTSL